MQLVFAFDQCAHRFVGQRPCRAPVRGAHKRGVVHSQGCEVVFVREGDVLRGQYFAISFQMDALVIDDDAVKVKKDRCDHLRVLLSYVASWPEITDEGGDSFSIFSFCCENNCGSRSLSSTSSRRRTSVSDSSFFRLT